MSSPAQLAEHPWAWPALERIQELLPHPHGHPGQRRYELVRDAQPPAMMIAVDDDSGSAIALAGGRQHRERCSEG